MDHEFDCIQKCEPFTPWVGRSDKGAVPEFIASAALEDARRSRQNSKKS